jgi:retron-type reverse transcriptase
MKNHQIDHPFPFQEKVSWQRSCGSVVFYKGVFSMIKNGSYKLIYDFENLYQSAETAAEDKRYKGTILNFFDNLEENIIQLQNELIWKTYELGPFFTFEKYEPKRRVISALPFRDRVVQIALCNIIEPAFEEQFIYDTYACRANKGTHAAANRLSYFLGKQDAVKYLKCDIHDYFKSIDIELLQQLIMARYVEDDDIMWLIHKILYHEYTSGIKIGNRFSQLAANAFLGELDFYLKVKNQTPYYIRYMDDFIIVSDSKAKLKNCLSMIEDFLDKALHLKLNDKTKIDSCRNGIDFVGYKIFPKNKIIKKQSMNRTRNVFRGWRDGKITDEKYLASIGSRCGHAKGTASYKFYMNILLKSLQNALNPERKVSHP